MVSVDVQVEERLKNKAPMEIDLSKSFADQYGLLPVIVPKPSNDQDYLILNDLRKEFGNAFSFVSSDSILGKSLIGSAPTISELMPHISFGKNFELKHDLVYGLPVNDNKVNISASENQNTSINNEDLVIFDTPTHYDVIDDIEINQTQLNTRNISLENSLISQEISTPPISYRTSGSYGSVGLENVISMPIQRRQNYNVRTDFRVYYSEHSRQATSNLIYYRRTPRDWVGKVAQGYYGGGRRYN